MSQADRRRIPPWRIVVTALGFAVANLGCASFQDPDATPRFLSDYERLQPGADPSELRYTKPDAEFESYNAVLLEPVQVWRGPQTSELSIQDAQKLANRLYMLLYTRLSRDFRMVRYPNRGVLRIGTALAGTRGWRAQLETVSTVITTPARVTELDDLATGTPAVVGQASIEARMVDGASGEVLMEAVDHHMGREDASAATSSWSEVDRSFASWADQLALELCQEQKRSDCAETRN